jgi:hypothetical protein
MWPTIFATGTHSIKVQLFLIEDPNPPAPVALNGRGFDSGGLMENASTLQESRSFVRPWDDDGIIAPFNWKSSAVYNARMEIARNLSPGIYLIELRQTGDEGSGGSERGVFCGRVISRRPSSGWLQPENGNIVPRFEEYEPYNANNGRYDRCGSMSRYSTLFRAIDVSPTVDWWSGPAHEKITQVSNELKYDAGTGFVVVAIADLDDGWNGPYDRVVFTWNESSDVANEGNVQIVDVNDDGAHFTAKVGWSGSHDIARVYANMLVDRNIGSGYVPTDGEGETPFQYTHYQFTAGVPSPNNKIAIPFGGTDEGHDETEKRVVYFEDCDYSPRIYVSEITRIAGVGNFDTNSEKQWVNGATKKFYTTLADTDVSVESGDQMRLEWDSYFAGPEYFEQPSFQPTRAHALRPESLRPQSLR